MDDPGGVRALLAKLREQDEGTKQVQTQPCELKADRPQRPWASTPKQPYFSLGVNKSRYNFWQSTHEESSTDQDKSRGERKGIEFLEALDKAKTLMKDVSVRKVLHEVRLRWLMKMREKQLAFEQQLAKERTSIVGENGEKLHGVNGGRVQAEFGRWTWDVLPRWDHLQHEQQLMLEDVGQEAYAARIPVLSRYERQRFDRYAAPAYADSQRDPRARLHLIFKSIDT